MLFGTHLGLRVLKSFFHLPVDIREYLALSGNIIIHIINRGWSTA